MNNGGKQQSSKHRSQRKKQCLHSAEDTEIRRHVNLPVTLQFSAPLFCARRGGCRRVTSAGMKSPAVVPVVLILTFAAAALRAGELEDNWPSFRGAKASVTT